MLKKVTDQEIVWVDLEEKVYDEECTVKIYFLGILVKTRALSVRHTMPDGKKAKIGFGNKE